MFSCASRYFAAVSVQAEIKNRRKYYNTTLGLRKQYGSSPSCLSISRNAICKRQKNSERHPKREQEAGKVHGTHGKDVLTETQRHTKDGILIEQVFKDSLR